MSTRLSIPIDSIIVPERLRTDYGDLDDLARSISTYGLIQPIVINQQNVLIAGGRRLSACKILKLLVVDVVYRETLDESELRELELEENVRRKDFDWRERVRSIREIHNLKRRNSALEGKQWGYRETGELLGSAHSQVAYALQAADLLDAGDADVIACASLADFLRLMLRRREDEANAELARRGLGAKKVSKPELVTSLLGSTVVPTILGELAKAGLGGKGLADEKHTAYLSRWLYNGDVRSFFKDEYRSDPAGDTISYIITDPPYAIEIDNLDQEHARMIDLDTIREEHNVDENVDLLKEFVPLAFHHMKSSGSWLVMWCDPYNWRWLCDLCESAGFRVQRWPLVWCKTHPCTNTNAMKNWTKTVDFALVASKGTRASLLTPQSVCHYACSNDETRRLLGHPFAKPLDLWKWLFRALIPPGLAYFDPFIGRGSSALAAIDLGITPIGCEINDVHFSHCYNNVRSAYERKFGKDNIEFK